MASRQQQAAGTANFSSFEAGPAPNVNQPEEADEFEDASEEYLCGGTDLLASFEDCELAIKKFFNNDLKGAMQIMHLWRENSMYHSHGNAMFEFIPAMLTFDTPQFGRALAAVKLTINICNRYRRNHFFMETVIRKPNYATYKDLEAHAELCLAEALLLQAAMTIMDGEDLTGLLKGTIKVKSCFSSYKECEKILEKKVWTSQTSKNHFQSGVRLGIATFNVMISLLPPKIISFLEFVGFSANKALGLEQLQAGSRASGLRSVLCDLTLLAYHLVICHFVGIPGDLQVCTEILRKQLSAFPNSVWFVMFKGRLEQTRGEFELAVQTYGSVVDTQHQWPHVRHICYWEIMWVNGLQLDWREASVYAQKLINESSWSRTIYSYSKAAFLLQVGDDLSSSEKLHCNDLMSTASQFRQRIVGKSLPMEKFLDKRCARYRAQGGHLLLPAIELLCLWNMFSILSKNKNRSHAMLRLIETARERVEGAPFAWMTQYLADNRALLRFLHGSCLSAMNLPRLALESFESIFPLKSDIKEDTFILPYTVMEMAMCHYRLGNRDQALDMLLDARKKYSGYSLESRLHFRLHAKIQLVKSGANITNDDT